MAQSLFVEARGNGDIQLDGVAPLCRLQVWYCAESGVSWVVNCELVQSLRQTITEGWVIQPAKPDPSIEQLRETFVPVEVSEGGLSLKFHDTQRL
jgi:hypothetical protein